MLKRHHSLNNGRDGRTAEQSAPISSRTRRAVHKQVSPNQRYETPDEEDELLDEALASVDRAVRRLDHHQTPEHYDPSRNTLRPSLGHASTDPFNLYMTPSPSANRNSVNFGGSQPLNIAKARGKEDLNPKWPTPPYEDNEWAASAAASIFAAQAAYQ